jgi:hypothetical protein
MAVVMVISFGRSDRGSNKLALKVAIEDLVGLAVIDDDTVLHHDHSVGEDAHGVDVVEHTEHCGSTRREVGEDVEHSDSIRRVERRYRLVEQQQTRRLNDASRKIDPLFLPAGKQRRIRRPERLIDVDPAEYVGG